MHRDVVVPCRECHFLGDDVSKSTSRRHQLDEFKNLRRVLPGEKLRRADVNLVAPQCHHQGFPEDESAENGAQRGIVRFEDEARKRGKAECMKEAAAGIN